MATQQQNNVELVRERYEAFNQRDLDAVVEIFDDDIEWSTPEGYRYGGTYHGTEEVGTFFERAFSDIEDLTLDVDRFIDGGETVVVEGTLQGQAAETGRTLDIPFAHVIDILDGKVTRFQEFADTARFEHALGD